MKNYSWTELWKLTGTKVKAQKLFGDEHTYITLFLKSSFLALVLALIYFESNLSIQALLETKLTAISVFLVFGWFCFVLNYFQLPRNIGRSEVEILGSFDCT